MAFTRRSFSKYPLHCGGLPLKFVAHYKYLGIIIDRGLTWSKHLKSTLTKTNNHTNVLRHVSGASWGLTFADLRQLHCSLIIGTLRYSLPTLHGLSRNAEMELLRIQARSLRVCLGVPGTTETYSVLAEAKEPPPYIQRERETLRTYTRFLTRHQSHYLQPVESNCPSSAFGAAVSRLKSCIASSTAHFSYAPPMWTLYTPTIHTDIPGLAKKSNAPPIIAHQLVLEHLDTAHHRRREVYTDGSVVPGSSTAAFYLPSYNIQQGFKLPHETSSTEAELYAIYAALSYISLSLADNWTILTDSKSELQMIASYCANTINDICPRITKRYNELLASGHTVSFHWVPGHIGLHGNTYADDAARRAHEEGEVIASVPMSSSTSRIQVRRLCARNTLHFIENALPENTFLHSIDPKMEYTTTLRLTRREETIVHRLRLNVARTPSLLFKMGELNLSACATCRVEAVTAHLLQHCRRYDTARDILKGRLTALGHTHIDLSADWVLQLCLPTPACLQNGKPGHLQPKNVTLHHYQSVRKEINALMEGIDEESTIKFLPQSQ
ncbi:uncharacterized protein LOC135395748 [Ornithodoros turicata]|uniref:uncharacterized protein LOC135395748 n=1 Tax=Ornithodoros turicata TaxID=34597 RepID=UPI0031399689